jgi:hypothetical protein
MSGIRTHRPVLQLLDAPGGQGPLGRQPHERSLLAYATLGY